MDPSAMVALLSIRTNTIRQFRCACTRLLFRRASAFLGGSKKPASVVDGHIL
jgi:hypothetical protein